MKNLFLTTVLLLIGIAGFSQDDCTGQRVPIHSLQIDDRIILNQLILDYVQSEINPNYDPDGEWPNNNLINKYDIVAQHTNYNMNPIGEISPWHGPTETFFSWHRDYLAGLEQYILDQGCDICANLVPLPYWDITMPLSDPFYNSMIPEFAVENALVVALQPLFITPQSETWGDFILPMNESPCEAFENIDEYADWMLGRHAQVHFEMGGAMRSFASTAGTAVFWLYHAYIDEKYYCYQQECQCPQVDISGSLGLCEYCFDVSESTNTDAIAISLYDVDGTSISVNLDENNCIPLNKLDYNTTYTVDVTAINSSMLDNVTCGNSLQTFIFTVPPKPRAVFPCFDIIVENDFFIPGEPTIFHIENTGAGRNFNIYNLETSTGNSQLIYNSIQIASGESIEIEIPNSMSNIGNNHLVIESEGQSINVSYVPN